MDAAERESGRTPGPDTPIDHQEEARVGGESEVVAERSGAADTRANPPVTPDAPEGPPVPGEDEPRPDRAAGPAETDGEDDGDDAEERPDVGPTS